MRIGTGMNQVCPRGLCSALASAAVWDDTFVVIFSHQWWHTRISPVSYNFAVESLKMAIVFKPKLYEYPKDNFGLKIIGKYKWIKKTGFDWSIVT